MGRRCYYAAHRTCECHLLRDVVTWVYDGFCCVRRLCVKRQCKYTKSQNYWPQTTETPFHRSSSKEFFQAIKQRGLHRRVRTEAQLQLRFPNPEGTQA